MVNTTKSLVGSILGVAAVVFSVEYFKIWTKENYDIMHCYTREVQIPDTGIIKVTSNGTHSCDVEAQHKQLNKRFQKLKALAYCVNENLQSPTVIDTVVGYYAVSRDAEDQLLAYCQGEVEVLL